MGRRRPRRKRVIIEMNRNDLTGRDELLGDADLAAVADLKRAREQIMSELSKVVVGQQEVIEQLLITVFARGHCLLVGVPGLAKTLLIRTLAGALSLEFSRIQFTPDLMPADITGTEVIEEDRATGHRAYRFLPGPIFANVILADEINRTPPKTQAALLEAMQEHQVTAGGERHVLAEPFFVLATQNPLELEGTYPLPEAQLDRFMFHVQVDYPSEDEELEIVQRTTSDETPQLTATLNAQQIIQLTHIVRRIPVADHVARYALRIARRTRHNQPEAAEFVKQYVMWGAGPRASQYLVLGAKARAALSGRLYAGVEDVQAVAAPVLRHRIKTTFSADAEGITPDDIIRRVVAETPTQVEDEAHRGRVPQVFRSADAR
jgi:MoxR-like ATPase